MKPTAVFDRHVERALIAFETASIIVEQQGTSLIETDAQIDQINARARDMLAACGFDLSDLNVRAALAAVCVCVVLVDVKGASAAENVMAAVGIVQTFLAQHLRSLPDTGDSSVRPLGWSGGFVP